MQANFHPVLVFATSTLLSLVALSAGQAIAQIQSPLSAQPSSQPIRDGLQLKSPVTTGRAQLTVPDSASMTVKQIDVKPGEFPQITASQYKVAFECKIATSKPQTDFSKFPRYSCFLDQPRTSAMNGLPIYRVDYFPSVDGITTKIVMVADKNAKNPNPDRIRAAFQLMHEKNETTRNTVLKDFVYADGLLNTKISQ